MTYRLYRQRVVYLIAFAHGLFGKALYRGVDRQRHIAAIDRGRIFADRIRQLVAAAVDLADYDAVLPRR